MSRKPCDICGSRACERDEDGTLLGCDDCGYDAVEIAGRTPLTFKPLPFHVAMGRALDDLEEGR